MATIYSDQHRALKDLLAMAGKNEDATLLIPDLQRPYVWQPKQVVVLVDSLIRGWPFGTLLTWKVRPDDPARDLARSFWMIVDRTRSDDGEAISKKHPPATFHMVLDGQQRAQSLLLALGGDGWGFKLLDRQWHEQLSNSKPRGPRGKPHWSLGCLCVDIPALAAAYAIAKRATAIDYSTVLKWVVTDSQTGQSKLDKPRTYVEPLEKASDSKNVGRFVRLARLWEAAPEQAGIDPYEAEDLASAVLAEHGVPDDVRRLESRPVGALLLALRDVKQTRVTYLELAEYEEALGTREVYNDAVVNIFTRLNTAGRTLTREDITFAWLKIGWNTACTQNENAKACIETLARQLDSLLLPISVDDVVSAIGFIWSVSFNAGKLLNNDDLMRGEAIRPMAVNISENWALVVEAAIQICSQARDRGLRFREHYQSFNALAYLWTWYFAALRWEQDHKLAELDKDSLRKSLSATLDELMDRWLIGSQWAGVWATASAWNIAAFALRLATCIKAMVVETKPAGVAAALKLQLESEVKGIEQDAVNQGISTMNADDRQQVRSYYSALWIWNRLDQNRWQRAKLALRQERRAQNRLEVDHIVAWELWQSKMEELVAKMRGDDPTASGGDIVDEWSGRVNDIGNCMLLEKNFNIVKGKHPLKYFLDDVHEFKQGIHSVEAWASALDLDMPLVDSANVSIEVLQSLIAERTSKIRADLEQFVRGTKLRVDL